MRPERVLAVVGPTATGKTDLAVALALRLGGEIITADSMQVYRGMDIGTAKPSAAERRGVPHHLVDIRDPTADFSVAEFQALADAAIADISARGRLPILSGGTGLYVRAVLSEYTFTELDVDPELRAELNAEAGRLGPPALHARLAQADPAAAARIHPNDQRRIVRALEVYLQTGRPISELQVAAAGGPRYDYLMVGLTMDRDRLYRRIDQRVDAMLAAGWLDEVHRLLRAGCSPYRGPLINLGYRELAAYLRGLCTLPVAVDWTRRNTRRYAKRQLTWFRREPAIRWVSMDDGPEAALETVLHLAEGKWRGRGEVGP